MGVTGQALDGADCVTLACVSVAGIDFLSAELLLFAGVWFFLGALDDMILDCLWLWQRLNQPKGMHIAFVPPDAAPTGRDATVPPRHAVFIPAWEESGVIADMIGHCLHRWQCPGYRLYIGVYANDPATGYAVLRGARGDDRVRVVPLGINGPTSKADCLNRIWQAMLTDENEERFRYFSVVLHDAEDVVHPAELELYDKLLGAHDFVQLPVSPLIDPAAPLISGHYADEFAEAHARSMPVRSRLGIAMPCAGVGCGFARDTLERLAAASPGHGPFATDSLTEDYELGIRIHERGGRGLFVRAHDDAGDLIATRAYFPSDLSASVRQKTRWTIGIALSGWDRTGWGRGVADVWMRMRDRRAALAALVLVTGYLGLCGWLIVTICAASGVYDPGPPDPAFSTLMFVNGVFLVWRIAIRAWCTGERYGVQQALWSVPRAFVSNVIAVMAARRALMAYCASLRGAPLFWDKTRHQIPAAPTTSFVANKPSLRLISEQHARRD